MQKEIFKPNYRNCLKAKVFEAGFRTLSEYAESAGVDIARISRIISGWELPSEDLAKKMIKPLGISIEDFSKLL